MLKEADALHTAGYTVSVVAINNHNRQRQFDEELMSTRQWSLRTVNFRKEVGREKLRWLCLSVKQKTFKLLAKITLRFGISERAAEKAFDGLVHLAKMEKADLYLVHHAEALGAGFRAAQLNNAKFGFDGEDFHTGMNDSGGMMNEMIFFLENKYLPHCAYLTAASNGIGEAYSGKYKIRPPVTILNVFPKERLEAKKGNNPIKFYWYSQVIGPNRGLETLMEAAGKLEAEFEIHLRGSFHNEEYRNFLSRLAKRSGIEARLFIHEPIGAEKIVSDGNRFDIGLALESKTSTNANLAVSNKLFSYLMSGLALIATDTYGQKDIFNYFPEVGRICRMDDPEDLAAAMKFYIGHPEKLLEAKKAARAAAETRFNWETESKKLLDNIKACLA